MKLIIITTMFTPPEILLVALILGMFLGLISND